MSGSLCRECRGKFGPGDYCEVCENLLRLEHYLKSPRCPGVISPFVAGKLREAHRLILEEAERFWVAQPIPAEGPAGCTPKSGSPVAPGGTEKGVGKGAEAPGGDLSGSVGEGTLGEAPADEYEDVKVEEDQHHEKSERKEEKTKRKRRKHRGSDSSGERERKKKDHQAVSSSRKKVRERSPIAREERDEEPSPGSRARGSGVRRDRSPEDRRPGPSSSVRRPREPSNSPPRKKWEGPIPAFNSRTKYWGKNKGKKKRESQVKWKRGWSGRRR